MERVTVEQAKKAIQDHLIEVWCFRRCSICGVSLTYTFGDDEVHLDTNCACVKYMTQPEAMTIATFISDTFNLQIDPKIREAMWEQFVSSGLGKK